MRLEHLLGRKAIVTGGSRGIGREIAKRLGRDGAEVILTYSTNLAAAESASREVAALSRFRPHIRRCDVALENDIRRTVEFAVDTMGAIDILVNNAGIMNPCDPIDFDPNEARKVMDVNVFGPARFVALARPFMQKTGTDGLSTSHRRWGS